MTVVEANVSGEIMHPMDNDVHPKDNFQLLIEGIAQNTMGNVFIPEVSFPPFSLFNSYDGVLFLHG